MLRAHGIATVFVSHKLEEVMRIAERVTVLRDGNKVGTYPAREIDRSRLTELMTGQKFGPPQIDIFGRGRPHSGNARSNPRGHYEEVDLFYVRAKFLESPVGWAPVEPSLHFPCSV